nr:Dyp-type peroxidase [Leucobacter luti]
MFGVFGGGLVAGGLSVGIGSSVTGRADDVRERGGQAQSDGSDAPTAVESTGPSQAGVDRPETPQRFGLLRVLNWPERDQERVVSFLGALGRRISELAVARPGSSEPVLPDGAGNLTVTVGVSADLVRQYGPDFPGGAALPPFVDDGGIDPAALGGDILLMLASDDPVPLSEVADALGAVLVGSDTRWEQRGYRGPSIGARTRNPFGFHDGVIVPQGKDELDENVWFGPPHARATVCVVRRFDLDVDGFRDLPTDVRSRTVGRDVQGVALSGGAPFHEADLLAKHPNGELKVPAQSHLRAAHPSFTGSRLMLRRGYAYQTESGGSGLLFISYQRDLRTFVETLRRMHELDDSLMRYAVATAGASFLILPGYDDQHPLGQALYRDSELRQSSESNAHEG